MAQASPKYLDSQPRIAVIVVYREDANDGAAVELHIGLQQRPLFGLAPDALRKVLGAKRAGGCAGDRKVQWWVQDPRSGISPNI